MSGQLDNKGLPTCLLRQVTSQVGDEASSARINANNAWYVNTSNGNRNNNNTNNRNRVVGSSELIENCQEWMDAEAGAYKNKHHNFDAARFHFHLPELYELAFDVTAGKYEPRPMTAFVLSYPVYREAFAPDHRDCIVHHYIAPLFNAVADGVHADNGDISHGNRIGHSAQGMAERIREDIRYISQGYTRPCVHMHRDISGFFLSINRQQAYGITARLAEHYYNKPDRDEKLQLLKVTLTSDPMKDLQLKSPAIAWIKHIPSNKMMANARHGCGLPIGKYPSQVVAGIVLSLVDAELAKNKAVRAEHFVDDYSIIAHSTQEAEAAINSTLPIFDSLGLKLHPRKISVQPAANGILSCGRVVKRDRIYVSNRTVRACKAAIREAPRNETGAKELCRSINSYFGLMCHCNAWNIQKTIAAKVNEDFGTWLYFKYEPNHLICKVRRRYSDFSEATLEIVKLISKIHYETRKDYQRNYRPGRSGKRSRGRRKAA